MKVMDKVYEVESTLTGEQVNMEVDPGSMAHIMKIMTNIYSDPVLACIREYSTNALDAHKVAGQTRPIEVTLPSSLAPFFSVRDFGEGLDRDDIHDIYRMYGVSTKRDSNDVTGMLGIGCKSALAYTNGFTLVAIKNGWLTSASIHLDEEGNGVVDIMDPVPSDEPSGVEVIIPVLRNNDFEQTAHDFFRFWEPGTVLLNGEQPKRIDGIWISDDLLLTQEINRDIVVMGGVPYPMDEEADRYGYGYNHTKTVAFVEIGSLAFAPSREALFFNSRTKETIRKLKERVKTESQTAFQKMIDEAPTKQDALKVYLDVVKVGFADREPKWNGQVIPLSWKAATGQYFLTAPAEKRYRGRGNRGGKDAIIPNNTSYSWVYNFDGAELTAYKREKLDQYMDRMNLPKPQSYVLVDILPVVRDVNSHVTDRISDWFPKNQLIDWSVASQEKIIREKVQRGDGRPSGSYHGIVAGTRVTSIQAADIDTNEPIFYERGATSHYGFYESPAVRTLKEKYPTATIIVLGQNRIAKFVRDFPMAQETNACMREAAKAWSDSLTQDEKMYLALRDDRHNHRLLEKLKPLKDQINDPKLAEAVELATQPIRSALVAAYDEHKPWGGSYNATFKSPTGKYPLLTDLDLYGNLNGTKLAHMVIYLNAAFAAAETEV